VTDRQHPAEAVLPYIPMIYIFSAMAMHEPTFFILTSLTGPPLHGYAIIQAVVKLSDGRVALRAGTLYAALDRLAADGLIAVDREEVVDSRLRRYYRLTDTGTAGLSAEVDRMRRSASVAAAGLRRLGSATFGFGG
jgi:PadR family transcriptional regulator PadR